MNILEGQSILVTGGASGIGRACALHAAQRGAKVTIADINARGGRATASEIDGTFVAYDAAAPDDAQRAVSAAIKHGGGLHGVVVAAAHIGGFHSAAEMSRAEWREVMDVSLDGAFHVASAAAGVLRKQEQGAIVFIASVEGLTGAYDHAAYVTAKSALFGLTRSMAMDEGPYGIRVNAVSPGIIDAGRPDQELAKQNPRHVRFWEDMTVLGRMGRPEEIASVVSFLLSSEASYLTGQNIAVDGGWTIGYPRPEFT